MGGIGTAVLIALVVSCLIAATEVRYRSGARWRCCPSGGLALYAGALGLGNVVATVAASRFIDVNGLGVLTPLIYAFLGVFSFEAVLNNVNITYLGQGVLTIQDWTRKARDIAEAEALGKQAAMVGELQGRLEQVISDVSEEKLDSNLASCCGGTEFVKQVEADAEARGDDAKLYKAMELAERAPKRAAAILKALAEGG